VLPRQNEKRERENNRNERNRNDKIYQYITIFIISTRMMYVFIYAFMGKSEKSHVSQKKRGWKKNQHCESYWKNPTDE
jgi:hypothetical protein